MHSRVEIELPRVVAVVVHSCEADSQIAQGLVGPVIGYRCQELRNIARAILEYPIAYSRQVLVDRPRGVASGVSLKGVRNRHTLRLC